MFFIVWGWRSLTKTLSEGLFHCPREGGDRTYWLVQARRWFTLFWIPVIPLRVVGEYVQCASCGSTFEPSVRELPTTAEIEDALTEGLRNIVVQMIRADGMVLDAERQAAVAIVSRFTTSPYSLEALDRDLQNLSFDKVDITRLAGLLNEHGKESVINACAILAMSDGDLGNAELKQIAHMGRELGLSPAHIRGILSDAVERSRTNHAEEAPGPPEALPL